MSTYDIEKYFKSFPYTNFHFAQSGRDLFFIKEENNKKFLQHLCYDGEVDLSRGETIFAEDLRFRSFRLNKYDGNNKQLYIIADQDHDEKYNLYRLNLSDQKLTQLTHVDFASGGKISEDFKFFHYGDRKTNTDGTFTTTFKKLDLVNPEEETYFCDEDWEYRMSWGEPLILPEDDKVLMPLNYKNIRHRTNLALIDLKTGDHQLLLDKTWENQNLNFPWPEVWKDHHVFLKSSHEGQEEIYDFNYKSREARKLTDLNHRNNGLTLLKINEEFWIAAAVPHSKQASTSLNITNVVSGETKTKSFPGEHMIANSGIEINIDIDNLWLYHSSATALPSYTKYDINDLRPLTHFNLAHGESPTALVHSQDLEYLEYPSFDDLKIPAYLVLPKGELKAALVIAFYGGNDFYSNHYQHLLEQGIAILSPAVRGSWGWGKDWEGKIKGDLGGNEILDAIWGARFLEQRLGLSPKKIGIEGGSHGGYAALRALTMPEGYNGVKGSHYPFGFGIVWAGFADLVKFHETSWIADWLVDLLGPINENKEKYLNRSPVNHFEELSSPVFIVHGTHDKRVPPETMTEFIDKLEASDKAYKIHYVKGQGHTAGVIEDKVAQYTDELDFLREFQII